MDFSIFSNKEPLGFNAMVDSLLASLDRSFAYYYRGSIVPSPSMVAEIFAAADEPLDGVSISHIENGMVIKKDGKPDIKYKEDNVNQLFLMPVIMLDMAKRAYSLGCSEHAWVMLCSVSGDASRLSAAAVIDAGLIEDGFAPADQVRSTLARLAADSRHAENRSMKAEIFSWLDVNMVKFKSMDGAAEAITKTLAPIKFRTARDWVGEWKKIRSASRP